MALERQHCVNHPDRPAIGVCVETKKPICGECSTRYNGVNYSREGLELLRERRLRAAAAGGASPGAVKLAVVGLASAATIFGFYFLLGRCLIQWLHPQ